MRKIKYGKHKHLPEDNFNSEDISEEDKRKREILEINSIEILICCLTVVPSMWFFHLDMVKNYILSNNQKLKEFSLLNELSNIILYKDNFGSKYEVNICFLYFIRLANCLNIFLIMKLMKEKMNFMIFFITNSLRSS